MKSTPGDNLSENFDKSATISSLTTVSGGTTVNVINSTVSVTVTGTSLSNSTHDEGSAFPPSTPAPAGDHPFDTTILLYILVPLCVCIVFIVVFVIVYTIIRRRRLDRLRHTLMPLYSFDPTDAEDWEAELLPENQASKLKPNSDKNNIPAPDPVLKFSFTNEIAEMVWRDTDQDNSTST